MSPDELLSAFQWRYATKKFDPARKIDPALWTKLEEAARLAPSSFGLQPWKFFVVGGNADLRAKLRDAAWKQPQVTDASHLVVFAVRRPFGTADVDRHVARTAEVRGVPAESMAEMHKRMTGFVLGLPPAELEAWCRRQVYIALGFFLAACAASGVDACPMEGFEPARFDELLGLPAKGYSAAVLATAGYRAADDKYAGLAKSRFPPAEVVEHVG